MRAVYLIVLMFLAQSVTAQEFGGYVTLTTDYVKRGVSQSDGDPAIQAGLEMTTENGFFAGVWASTVDIQNNPTRKRDREVDYYAGYVFDATDTLRLSAAAVAYRYPAQTGDVNYNYEEYSVTANFSDMAWLEVAYSPDLYNSGDSSTNLDLYAEWPLNSTWSIGGGGGYYDVSRFSGRGYSYWQLGVTATLRWADIDLRIHDTARWVPVISTPDRAKSRLVLKIQIPF